MGVFADTLRQARAQKGVTLKEVEQATRINRHHLSALEDENFAVLPPLIYQRGIVRNYATYLGLDPGKLLAMFEEARGGETTTDLVAAVKPIDIPTHWAPNFAIIAFMVVMGAIVFAWVYSLAYNEAPATATLPPSVPTVTPIPADQLVLPSPTPVAIAPLQPANATAQTGVGVVPGALTPAVSVSDGSLTGTTNPGQAPGTMPQPTGVATQPALVLTPTPVPTATATPIPPPTATVPPVVAAPQGPTATIRVIAQGDIQVTIVADGATVFSGWLGQGGVTDWFTATSFQVTTTDGNLTLFENAGTGQQFYMGYGPNETYALGA